MKGRREKQGNLKPYVRGACVAEFEETWTALPSSWLQVWPTLPDMQFSPAIRFTRHIRKTNTVF
jgi:hypothetical protein